MCTNLLRRTALLILLPPLCASLAPFPAEAGRLAGAGDPLPIADAKERLEAASSVLRDPRAIADEAQAALEELAQAHAAVGGEARERQAFRRKAEAVLVKALRARRPHNATRDTNRWHDVNVLAAEQLARMGATLDAKEVRALSLRIRAALTDRAARRRKPNEWHPDFLRAAFAALAALNDHGTLAWMLDTYHHSKERELSFLVAAHEAMVRFRNIPGKLRHAVCKQMIQSYAGVEAAAERASNSPGDVAKKRVWDRIRIPVIRVLQHFARAPRNEDGQAFSTVVEFQHWWQYHEDVRKAPWID